MHARHLSTRRAVTLCIVMHCMCISVMAQDTKMRISQHKRGFVISHQSAGHDRIIARTDHGTYDDAVRFNPTFRAFVEAYGNHVPSSAPRWMSDEATGNYLCSDLWGQYSPYNNLCPMVDTTLCMTGCVANAMAEVMYYYRHPLRGTGRHTYTDSIGCGQTLTADFASHTYDYDYMLDSYEGNYSARQADAVAQLLSDCGISVNMRYGIEASGAQSIRQPIALTQHFGYGKGIRHIFRDFYNRTELHALLMHEIDEGRPVLCSGYGIDGGGHAFVIDGYDADGLFHINWGWNGYANGFYDIDYMNSHQPEWNLFRDRRELGMNILQSFTVGIQPVGSISSADVAERHEYAFSHMEMLPAKSGKGMPEVVVHDLSNIGWNVHDGRVVLGLCKADDGSLAHIIYNYDRVFALEELTDSTYTDTIAVDVTGLAIDNGTYRLVPLCEESDGTWHEARTTVGTPNFVFADVNEGNIILRKPEGAAGHLVLDHFEMPDTVVRWQSPAITLRVTNPTDTEYCGRIYVAYELPESADGYGILAGVGLYIKPHGTEELDFRYSPVRNRNDKMRIHVFYDTDLFTGSIIEFPVTKDVTIVAQATDITHIEAETEAVGGSGQTYDLSGRKVADPHRGIVLKDGKKLLIH